MGQKVNPLGFRIGTFQNWKSRWFADSKTYKNYLLEDIKIRKALFDKFKLGGVANVEIERLPKSMVITMTVSRPGVVIGRGGSGIEDIKKTILSILKKLGTTDPTKIKIEPRIVEIKNPEISAYLVAERIVADLERRMPHRRVVTRTMERVMQAGAKGIKIVLAGRIAGADISRVERYHMGSVPTQTLRKHIDYTSVPALLKRGYVGIKVYIHKLKED